MKLTNRFSKTKVKFNRFFNHWHLILELKTKYKSTKADLHKTEFLKSEQLKANLKQYHRTKELCNDLDKNEGDIVSLQRAIDSSKSVINHNASSVSSFKQQELPAADKRAGLVQKTASATESLIENVKEKVHQVKKCGSVLESELETHASVSRKGFEDLQKGAAKG